MPNLLVSSKTATDNERSADKLLTKALLPSIVGIVICIILLCGTTFAWLNDSVQTGSSTLTAGNFAVNVSATNANANGTGMQYILNNGEECSVTVTNAGSSKNGYAILTIHNNETLTPYLIEFGESKPNSVTVTITTPDTGLFSVGVTSYWGTNSPSYYELPGNIDLTGTEETTTPETTADNNENENGGQ